MRNRDGHATRRIGSARRARQRGASMIEFAMVAFLLVLVMLGGIEVDRMILVYTNLANAAAEGARYGALQSAQDVSGVQTTVKNYAVGLNTSDLTVTVTYSVGDNSQAAGSVGSKVNVNVRYPYVAFVSGLFPSLTLTAISESVILY
jgi:Flp pilus assembly protein TadG